MNYSSIRFRYLQVLFFGIVAGCVIPSGAQAESKRPNVVVIMSDDQGGGDYGFQGNSLIETPALDAMFKNGGCLTNFYVSPVCAPTRASLMTGRYNYRTRCIDTYIGRAMMDSDEKTLAEYLQDAGYQTGIYGKWHLGDNYPLRANDQGFQDSLVHRGGGIGQPSDPIGAEGKYTDPTLIKNGIETPMKGYCTDIYFDAAMQFIDESVNAKKNFFTYIATNAPHGPFHDVPAELYEKYQDVDFSPILIKELKNDRLAKENDKLARIAAMITNIDINVGRLFEHLQALGVLENTIVIYLNDNGPNSLRFVGDMRGMKTHVDDGGIRSPLLFHWPAKVKSGQRSSEMCAHIDVLPTLLDACSVDGLKTHPVDGRSFLPLLVTGQADWPARSLVFQTHRGDEPQLYHHFAIHNGPWKLVHPSGFGQEKFDGEVNLELYNLHEDPRQQNNIAADKPEVFARLMADYELWFQDVSSTRPDNYAPPRIIIGTDFEPKTVLTRQDWRHAQGKPWAQNSNGSWLLEAEEPRSYEVEIIFNHSPTKGFATIAVGNLTRTIEIAAGQKRGYVQRVDIPQGQTSLSVTADFDGQKQGPHQVILQVL